jgi:hypothetical protein
MTGKLHSQRPAMPAMPAMSPRPPRSEMPPEPATPVVPALLLAPTQVQHLLDQVVYEQVLECIDLDALYKVEQSLVMHFGELDGVDDDQITEHARLLIDRALLRIPGDLRAYLSAAAWPLDGCELCEEEARGGSALRGGRAPIRFHS